jgi:hypothetical protein
MKDFDRWLEQFLKMWDKIFSQLDTVLEKLKNKKP